MSFCTTATCERSWRHEHLYYRHAWQLVTCTCTHTTHEMAKTFASIHVVSFVSCDLKFYSPIISNLVYWASLLPLCVQIMSIITRIRALHECKFVAYSLLHFCNQFLYFHTLNILNVKFSVSYSISLDIDLSYCQVCTVLLIVVEHCWVPKWKTLNLWPQARVFFHIQPQMQSRFNRHSSKTALRESHHNRHSSKAALWESRHNQHSSKAALWENCHNWHSSKAALRESHHRGVHGSKLARGVKGKWKWKGGVTSGRIGKGGGVRGGEGGGDQKNSKNA